MNYRRLTLQSPEGQTLSEYAMILSLIVMVVIAVLPAYGAMVLRLFDQFITTLTAVGV